MVTWWLVGQEEQRRDSLTGINMIRSEGGIQSRKNSLAMKDSGALNLIRSEEGIQSSLAMKDTGSSIVRSDGGRQSQMITLAKKDFGIRMGRNGSGRKSCSAAMNGAGVGKARSDGGLQSSSKRRGSIPVTKSEGFSSPRRGSARKEASTVEKAKEGNLNLERQSYSKIVSFNSGHSQNSSSSQEQLDQSLPLPGTVMSDNEPLL